MIPRINFHNFDKRVKNHTIPKLPFSACIVHTRREYNCEILTQLQHTGIPFPATLRISMQCVCVCVILERICPRDGLTLCPETYDPVGSSLPPSPSPNSLLLWLRRRKARAALYEITSLINPINQ